MNYFINTILNTDFATAEKRLVEALKKEGFGVISEIDMQAKLQEKLNVTIAKYKILGACNPSFAHKAIQAEEKIGVMLPCNVVIIDKENGTIEVAAVHPLASMMAVQNPDLMALANEVTSRLERVMAGL